MNKAALRLYVRSLITEAKEEKAKEAKLPKSSGKLMDLKKELEALEQYRDEIQVAKFAEKTASTEVEFADLAKFKKELDAIKEKGVKLEQALEAKIEEVKAKIEVQKNKIKEMIGMAPKAGQKKIEDVKDPKEAEPDEDDLEADRQSDADIEANQLSQYDEAKKPSAGMTKKAKSAVAKKAHAGKDIGKKGKGFEKVEKAAEKEYGSKEAGQKVAAAAMWKGQAKKASLEESEFTYRKINGVCYKIDDENNRTKVSDFYCR
jgi:hypothetical protein